MFEALVSCNRRFKMSFINEAIQTFLDLQQVGRKPRDNQGTLSILSVSHHPVTACILGRIFHGVVEKNCLFQEPTEGTWGHF